MTRKINSLQLAVGDGELSDYTEINIFDIINLHNIPHLAYSLKSSEKEFS